MQLNQIIQTAAGQTSRQPLNLADFTWSKDDACFVHPNGQKLAKISAVGAAALQANNVEYFIYAGQKGWAYVQF